MSYEERIQAAVDKLPPNVALKVIVDVNDRITDWIASGGNEDDPYIEQQVRYAENVAEAYEKERSNFETN